MMIREPVLGIHDLAPPEGRVTVELLDERGLRVLKRVRADNAVMNFWTEATKKFIRGDPTYSNVGYQVHGATQVLSSDTDLRIGNGLDNWWQSMRDGKTVWNHPTFLGNGYHSILLTDSTQAVDADEIYFPGSVTAFCYLPEAYAPGTNTKRAQLVLASSFRTVTALRYQAEWGTAYGNGTINSVGVGCCTFPSTTGLCVQQFAPYGFSNLSSLGGDASLSADFFNARFNCGQPGSTNFFGANTLLATDAPTMSGHRVTDAEVWVLQSTNSASYVLCKMDFTTTTARPFSANSAAAGVALSGPTMTTIGASTSRCGVAVIGSDLWLAYGTTLKRCVKPTSTTLSVTNTYTPAGVGTLIDLTTDGTSLYWLDATKVWVIDATTGAVTTSWTHGLSGTMYNIAYLNAPASKPRLMISYVPTTMSASWNAGATARNPMLVAPFTTGGTAEPGTLGFNPHMYLSNNTNLLTSGLVVPMSNDCKQLLALSGFATQFGVSYAPSIWGPSHLSRTVLGSPIVKTSSNGLRCVYEFGFS